MQILKMIEDGTVTAANGWLDRYATGVTATATASNGYHFVHWPIYCLTPRER